MTRPREEVGQACETAIGWFQTAAQMLNNPGGSGETIGWAATMSDGTVGPAVQEIVQRVASLREEIEAQQEAISRLRAAQQAGHTAMTDALDDKNPNSKKLRAGITGLGQIVAKLDEGTGASEIYLDEDVAERVKATYGNVNDAALQQTMAISTNAANLYGNAAAGQVADYLGTI